MPEVPTSGGGATQEYPQRLTKDESDELSRLLELAFGAWGRDPEYYRLWSSLNLTLTAWLYRRVVLTQYSPKTIKIQREQFGKCLMAVSASGKYLDWLVGRNLSERDRSPAYGRIKTIFTERLRADTGKQHIWLPGPAWAHGGGSKHDRDSLV